MRRFLIAFVAVSLAVPVTPVRVVAAPAATDELEGSVVAIHDDDLEAGLARGEGLFLDTGNEHVRLKLPRGQRPPEPGSRVRVRGERGEDGIAVSADGLVTLSSGESTAISPLREMTVAVLLVNFSTDTRQPWTRAGAGALFFGGGATVKDYFAEGSYGQVAVRGDVFGYLTVTVDRSRCDHYGWSLAARTRAVAMGIDLTAYTNIVYAWPAQSSCSWTALGQRPGRHSWLNGVMSLRLATHELGHNLSVHHASSIDCTDASGVRVPLSTRCTSREYGDPFTVMGSARTRHSHPWHRVQMSWIPSSGVRTVVLNGTYALAPAGVATGTRLLRVLRPDGTYLLLDLRRPVGTYFDAWPLTDPAVNGVAVRIAGTGSVQSKLIDTTPGTVTHADAPLALGKTFLDPIARVTVTVTALSSSGASVKIVIGSATDTVPPTAPGNLVATATGATTASLSWSPSTDDITVAGYRVYRDGVLRATTTGPAYADTGLVGGRSYLYRVVAFDPANNVSAAASTSLVMPVIDVTAPSTPTGLSIRATGPGAVSIGWSASTDDVKVAGYRVFRDGTSLGLASTPGSTDSGLASGRSYRYAVAAFDAAGNVSGTAEATFVMPDLAAPGAVASLTIVATTSGEATLRWDPASDDVAVTGYRVYRDDVLVATVAGIEHHDPGLTPGASYRYAIRAMDAAGNMGAAAVAVVTVPVPDTTPPSSPAGLVAERKGRRNVRLTWHPASDADVAGYVVLRDGAVVATTSETQHSERAVDGTVTYQVVAVDHAGNRSEPSAPVTYEHRS